MGRQVEMEREVDFVIRCMNKEYLSVLYLACQSTGAVLVIQTMNTKYTHSQR